MMFWKRSKPVSDLRKWTQTRYDAMPTIFAEAGYRVPNFNRIIRGTRHVVLPVVPQQTDVYGKPNLTSDLLKMSVRLERLTNTKTYAEWDRSTIYYFLQLPETLWNDLTLNAIEDGSIGMTEYRKEIQFELSHSFPHTIVAGATGSGKSVTLESIIFAIMKTSTPDDTELIIMDPHNHLGKRDNEVLGSFDNSAYLRYSNKVLTSSKEIVDALDYLHNVLIRRRAGEQGRRIIAILDEGSAQIFTAKTELLEDLTAEGRKFGLHFVIGVNKPDKLSTDLTTNLQQKIVGLVDNNNLGTRILGAPGYKFNQLLGKGDFIIKTQNVSRFQCATPTRDNFDSLERGSTIDRVNNTVAIPELPVGPKKGRPAVTIDYDALMQYLYYDPKTITEPMARELFGFRRRTHETHKRHAMTMKQTWIRLIKEGK